jgi:hypothetical protein
MSIQHTKLIHQHSFDTVTMSSGRRASRSSETSFTCSQQSILSAMERFVKSVNNMDSTVLVPIKLRDMDLKSTKAGASKTKLPTVLQNGDLYAFYLLLHDARKELLWGPSTALSAMGTFSVPSSLRSSSGTLNLMNASTSSNTNLPSPITSGWANSSSTSSASIVSSTSNGNANFTNRIVPSIAASKTSGSSASLVSMDATPSHTFAHPAVTSGSIRKRENTHSRQPSDDSLASFGSGTSTLDLDSESEADSLLHERDSNQTDHTLHLAASFKHHLQGLHTILHQLSDAADFFCARYQEEIDTPISQ